MPKPYQEYTALWQWTTGKRLVPVVGTGIDEVLPVFKRVARLFSLTKSACLQAMPGKWATSRFILFLPYHRSSHWRLVSACCIGVTQSMAGLALFIHNRGNNYPDLAAGNYGTDRVGNNWYVPVEEFVLSASTDSDWLLPHWLLSHKGALFRGVFCKSASVRHRVMDCYSTSGAMQGFYVTSGWSWSGRTCTSTSTVVQNQLWLWNVLWLYWHPYPHVVPERRPRRDRPGIWAYPTYTRLISPTTAYRGGNVLLVTNLLVIQGLCFLLLGNMEQGRRGFVIFFRFVPKVGEERITPAPFLIGHANVPFSHHYLLTVLATPLVPLSPVN